MLVLQPIQAPWSGGKDFRFIVIPPLGPGHNSYSLGTSMEDERFLLAQEILYARPGETTDRLFDDGASARAALFASEEAGAFLAG